MLTKRILGFTAAAVLAATATIWAGSLSPAAAQGRCEQLWYERNEIYARNGYCFRTARARSVFGPGCFPPYGRLSGYESQRVNQIQREEGMLGCPR